MQEQVAVWGWDGVAPWVKVLVDAAGHLQVDVLTAPAITGHCYGWTGAAWTPLLVESLASANLRTRLYGGANAVFVGQSAGAFGYGNYGLGTFATLYADDGTNLSRVGMLLSGADGVANTLNTLGAAATLYGYNGATWDRLRVDAAYNLQVDVNEVLKTDTSTIAQVSVGVASTAVLAANANRVFAEFVNDSDNVIYLALGAAAVMNRGIRLNANGGSFEIGLTNLYTGAVKAISGVAAQNLTVSEG
uniref:Uncharacterized protein n=1 Tax=viral metagenome TaxID=1070528 RepID=A0A6M3XW87_9ZZZZ